MKLGIFFSGWLPRHFSAILVVGMAISACVVLPSTAADSWREEVLLHDGRKIVVGRNQIYGPTPVIAKWPVVREHTLRFSLPGSARELKWTAQSAADTGGYAELAPLAVQVLEATPYVVATPVGCLAYNKWGRPNPPYVVFRHDGAIWQRVSLADLPMQFSDINLVLSTTAQDAEELRRIGLVTAPTVRKLNEDASSPELRTITRNAMLDGRCPQIPVGPRAPRPVSAASR